MSGFGVFLLFLYPGAFAEFKEELTGLGWLPQLKIYCAGSWHNIVLSGFSYLCLFLLPLGLFPLYYNAGGVVITRVEPESVMHGSIKPMDVITSVGDCSKIAPVRSNDRRNREERLAGVLRLSVQRRVSRRRVLPARGSLSRR